jgi:hypothetical protein
MVCIKEHRSDYLVVRLIRVVNGYKIYSYTSEDGVDYKASGSTHAKTKREALKRFSQLCSEEPKPLNMPA